MLIPGLHLANIETAFDTGQWEAYSVGGFTYGEVQYVRGDAQSEFSVDLWRITADAECPPSLRWESVSDEVLYIPYGEVDVELNDGSVIELRPGTIVSFEAGFRCVWRFKKIPFAEVFVMTAPHYDGTAAYAAADS